MIYCSPITQRNFLISRNIKGAGLANAILRQTGLPPSF